MRPRRCDGNVSKEEVDLVGRLECLADVDAEVGFLVKLDFPAGGGEFVPAS
jgi:hypothetical protein